MGFFASLLEQSASKMPELPASVSVFPQQAVSLLTKGMLPNLNTNTIMLTKNEACRFVDKAYLIHEDVIRRSRGRRSGMSFRIAKGITYHTGSSDREPIEEKRYRYIPGYFYITDMRVIFVSKEHGLDYRIDSITALIPYSNALVLQFKKSTVEFLLPRPDLAAEVLHMINRT